jgi:hypothetical protein
MYKTSYSLHVSAKHLETRNVDARLQRLERAVFSAPGLPVYEHEGTFENDQTRLTRAPCTLYHHSKSPTSRYSKLESHIANELGESTDLLEITALSCASPALDAEEVIAMVRLLYY